MTLSFPDKKTEGNLILRFRQSRNEMKETFMKYNILLEDIREGSIKFMFRFANRSDTLDELAHDQQIIKITCSGHVLPRGFPGNGLRTDGLGGVHLQSQDGKDFW